MISSLKSKLLLVIGLGLIVLPLAAIRPAAAITYPPGDLIDNYVFLDTGTMDQTAIQNFLVGKGSFLATYSTSSTRDSANVPASRIIYEAATDYGINPQVIMATLQKEQSLITDPSPAASQLSCAMGYFSCGQDTGFFNQVDNATWQFRFDYDKLTNSTQLGNGNQLTVHEQSENYPCPTPGTQPPYTNANNQNALFYYPGLLPGNNVTFYDGFGTPYASFNIADAATATLYCYTPHVYSGSPADFYSGTQNFENAFTEWGWALYSNNCVFENSSPVTSSVLFRKLSPNLDSGDLVLYTGTATNCIESHAWTPGSGFTGWQNHIASNLPVQNPADGVVKFADLTGNGTDNPIDIGLDGTYPAGTQSGYVEFHVWSNDMRSWVVHAISNLPVCDPANSSNNPAACSVSTNPSAQNSSIEFADLAGNGIDIPVAIQYKNTASGFVEFWVWNAGLQGWSQHIVSNLAAPLDPTKMQIGFADLDGSGKDRAIAFGISNTGTGMVEFHVWAPGEQTWQTHIVSNLLTSQLSGCSIQFADLSSDGRDNGVAVCTQGTTSGKIELHVWNPDLTSWQGHYTSNQATL